MKKLYFKLYKKLFPLKFYKKKMDFSRVQLWNYLQSAQKEIVKLKNENFKEKNSFKFGLNDRVKWSLLPRQDFVVLIADYKKEPETSRILDIEYEISCINNPDDPEDKRSYIALQDTLTLVDEKYIKEEKEKKKVYCIKCQWLSQREKNTYKCIYKENLKKEENWLGKDIEIKKAEEINKNNDCSWYRDKGYF